MEEDSRRCAWLARLFIHSLTYLTTDPFTHSPYAYAMLGLDSILTMRSPSAYHPTSSPLWISRRLKGKKDQTDDAEW